MSDSLDTSAELTSIARRLGDPFLSAWGHHYRYAAAFQAGMLDEADRALEAMERAAAEAAQPALQWLTVHSRAQRLVVSAGFTEAERLAGKALEIGIACGRPDAPLCFGALRYDIRYQQGRLEDLVRRLEEEISEKDRPVSHASLALAYCELDRNEEARNAWVPLATTIRDIPINPAWLHALASATAVCAHLNDSETAALLYELLLPYADKIAGNPVSWMGSVAHFLGLLDTTLGRFDDAEAHFAAAAAIHQDIAAPAWLARTRMERARMLLARGQPGDAERARELLSQVLATSRELELANVERRAVKLLR